MNLHSAALRCTSQYLAASQDWNYDLLLEHAILISSLNITLWKGRFQSAAAGFISQMMNNGICWSENFVHVQWRRSELEKVIFAVFLLLLDPPEEENSKWTPRHRERAVKAIGRWSDLLAIWVGQVITLKESPTAELIVVFNFGPGFSQNTLGKVGSSQVRRVSSPVALFPQSPRPWPWTRWRRWSRPCWCARTGSPPACAGPPVSCLPCSPGQSFRSTVCKLAHQVPYEGNGGEDNRLIWGDAHVLLTGHLLQASTTNSMKRHVATCRISTSTLGRAV